MQKMKKYDHMQNPTTYTYPECNTKKIMENWKSNKRNNNHHFIQLLFTILVPILFSS